MNSFSEVVRQSRFLLACVIVCLHCIGPDFPGFFPVFAFYFISGYFFFYKYSSPTIPFWGQSIKNRLFSLVIPYFIWNFLYAVLIHILDSKLYLENVKDNLFINLFWDSGSEAELPINGPLWYIKNLFVYVLLSPIILFLLKKLRAVSVLCFVTLFITSHYYHPILFLDSYFATFCIGAYCGINRLDVSSNLYKKRNLLIYSFFTMVFYYVSFQMKTEHNAFLHSCFCLMASMLVFSIVRFCVKKNIKLVPDVLTGASMYIYVVHMLFYCVTFGFLRKYNMEHGTRAIATPLILFFCILSYYILYRFTPKFLNLLMGDRITWQNLFRRKINRHLQ